MTARILLVEDEVNMARTLAKLQSPNNQPALRTERGARSWRVELVELRALDERGGEIAAPSKTCAKAKLVAAASGDSLHS